MSPGRAAGGGSGDEQGGAASGSWRPCLFKGTRVLARADAAGRLLPDEQGRVEMVYKAGGKPYRAAAANLKPLEEAVQQKLSAIEQVTAPVGAARPARPVAPPAAAVVAWTDGACLGNPGPTGAGVRVEQPGGVREVARYLGRATNNVGELTAVRLALELVEQPDAEVVVYTDSSYALGVLTRPWKPKKNLELIAAIKQLMRRFPRLHLRKVPGHAGVAGNERVDWLAGYAAANKADLDLFEPAATS